VRIQSLMKADDGCGCYLRENSPWKMQCYYGMDCSPVIHRLTWHRGYVWLCLSAFEISVCPMSLHGKLLLTYLHVVIPGDYSTQLTSLLRYPSLDCLNSSLFIHPISLLLRQALTLQMSPTASTGVSIVHENQNLLNISTEVPASPPLPTRRRPRPTERGSSISHIGYSSDGSRGHVRQGSNPLGIPEMIARGLLERGESLGINKTVMNAVSELRVINLPLI
jgi:hypothetical protein